MTSGGYTESLATEVADPRKFLEKYEDLLGDLPSDAKWSELTTLRNGVDYEDPRQLGPYSRLETLPDCQGDGELMARWLFDYETFKKYANDPANEEYATSLSFKGITELHLKAWKGSAADIDAVLQDHSIDARARFDEMQIGEDGFSDVTPLHIALCAGNADTAKRLLEKGANPRKWFSVAGHTIHLDRFGDYYYDCWQLAGPKGDVHDLIRNYQQTQFIAPTQAEWDFRSVAAQIEDDPEEPCSQDDLGGAPEDNPLQIVDMDEVSGTGPFKLLGQLNHYLNKVTAIAAGHVDNDVGILISGHSDGNLALWTVMPQREQISDVGKLKAELSGHLASVSDVVLAGKEQYAVSASADKQLRLWNLQTAECERVFNTEAENVAVSVAHDGRAIVSAGGSEVNVWNTLGECKKTAYVDDDVAALKVTVKSDGQIMALCTERKRVGIYNLQDGSRESVLRQEGNGGRLTTLAISPESPADLCFAGDLEGFVHAWRISLDSEEPSEHQASFNQDDGDIIALATSPSDMWIASASSTYTMVWNVSENTPLQKIDGSFTSLSFSASGRFLYAGTERGSISVFTVSSPNVSPM